MKIAIVDDDRQIHACFRTYFAELLGDAAELTCFFGRGAVSFRLAEGCV